MFIYNLKHSFRRILNDRVFSIIILVGLTIGISSFLILFLHVKNEKSFDKHFLDHQRIYRVTTMPVGSNNGRWARSIGIIQKASVSIPEIVESTQFSYAPIGSVKIGDQTFQQEDIMSVDSSFIRMFSVEAVIGDLADITKPNTVFISEDFAKKFFKDQNPIGKTIEIKALQYLRNLGSYEIRGVVKNANPKTHFNYHLLLSQNGNLSERYTLIKQAKIQWVYNYIKLSNGASLTMVASKLHDFYSASELKKARGPEDYRIELTPMDEIHLNSNDLFELRESTSKINIGLFTVVSLVILLVSLLNFINLIIARLIKRSKEIDMKRFFGISHKQLIFQLMTEVSIFCSVSVLLAFILIETVKPLINQFFDIHFDIFYSEPTVYLSVLFVFLVCLGLTVVFITVYFHRKSLNSNIPTVRNSYSGNFILKSLLLIQVSIVAILISSTLFVNKQIRFISNRPLGFDKENVVVLNLKDFSKDPAVFANELRKQSVVTSVGFSMAYFGYPPQSMNLDGLGIDGSADFIFANYDYLKTMNIPFEENWIDSSKDTVRGMVINEHLYRRLMEHYGSMDALNAYMVTSSPDPERERIKFIGVVKDFNYWSAHKAIGDLVFWLDESANRARFIHIRLKSGNMHQGISQIESLWNEYYPDQEFSYFFLDSKIESQYKAENILIRILATFSFMGIFICMIGISALALFISQQRTKEIGIRKVNGAKISEIIKMLNKDFLSLIAVAFVIAIPFIWYIMHKWLENFAYKSPLSWWVFALAGLSILGISVLSVSWLSWRAARANPVETLRYE